MKPFACAVLAVATALAGTVSATTGFDPASADLVLTGGLVVDGTGRDPYAADVAIAGGRIVFVGDVDKNAVPSARRLEANGRVVAPGFIDPHSHGDPLETPDFENFLAMGVTTITLGQDGASPDVDDLAAWLATVADRGIGPNLAMFAGHGTLRRQTGIGRDPAPTAVQMTAMLARLDEALDVAFGLSTGLEYNPGLNAGPEELAALARVVGARDRVIMSHLRSEDDPVLDASLDELIAQGAHARVHVSHLKSVYGRGAARGREILAHLAAARARGVSVTADLYPYTASYTGITLLFPTWAKTAEDFETARRTRRAELADYLRRRVMSRNGPEATLLGTPPWTGKTLAQVAGELDKPFEDVLIDDIGPGGADAAYFVMDESLQETLLLGTDVAVCSDGSPTGFHPRGHGTFARIIETFVRERGVLSLAEAVRRMTALPAAIIGLEDRGRISPGMAADIVVFDPAAVRERATYVAPLQLAEGFDVVIVNGRVTRRDGALTGVRTGTVLTP